MQKILLTPDGYAQLLQKMQQLEEHSYQQNQEEIKYYLKEGNLTENMGYHQAVENGKLLDKKIRELKEKISNSHVIDNRNHKSKTIKFGCTVRLKKTDRKFINYMIVGSEESNIKQGKISFESPLGKALIGHKKGDIIDLETSTEDVQYQIIKIWYK